MNKLFSMFILLFSLNSFASEFEETFDMQAQGFSRQANRVVIYLNSNAALDEGLAKSEFNYISSSMNDLQEQLQLNAIYWFVRGLNAKNMASFYQRLGDESQVVSLIQDKNKFYEKAINVDKDNEPHLTARAYASMKAGLPNDLKQQAIKAELTLGGSGENESYYWYLHWSNVNELKKLGRFDEAQQALVSMKNELMKSDQNQDFESLVSKIEKDLNKKEKPAANSKVDSEREHKTFTEEGVEDDYYRYLVIILGLMMILIAIAVAIEVKRRRKK